MQHVARGDSSERMSADAWDGSQAPQQCSAMKGDAWHARSQQAAWQTHRRTHAFHEMELRRVRWSDSPCSSSAMPKRLVMVPVVGEKWSGLNVGPDERFFIEYIGRQSTSEADDGQRGPHEGCS